MNINTVHEYSIQLPGSGSIIYTNLMCFFFLPDILKVLIDQVSTEGKLTIEWLSAASVKAMDYNSFYSVFNTINLEVFHFM